MATVSRNRLGNSQNGYQGNRKRVLCVCSAGLLRSPTLAVVLSQPPFNFNTRAVGTDQEFALVPIDAVHVAWAEEIVVMDWGQAGVVQGLMLELHEMSRGFDTFSADKPVHVFNIPDDYGFMDEQLVELLRNQSLKTFDINQEDLQDE